ncbi:MAG: YybH family protein [Pyrinomonadaceae bacterium]
MRRLKRLPLRFALIALLLAAFSLSHAACVQTPDSPKDNERTVADVRAVLDAQVAAWNRGDMEGYMDGYERADDIVFVSGDTVTRGWQTVLDRYKRGYDTREKMGTLQFSELEIKPLSPFYAAAVGRWHLTRANDTPHGRFTLLFRRTPNGWRIVHDHTSTASS